MTVQYLCNQSTLLNLSVWLSGVLFPVVDSGFFIHSRFSSADAPTQGIRLATAAGLAWLNTAPNFSELLPKVFVEPAIQERIWASWWHSRQMANGIQHSRVKDVTVLVHVERLKCVHNHIESIKGHPGYTKYQGNADQKGVCSSNTCLVPIPLNWATASISRSPVSPCYPRLHSSSCTGSHAVP